MGKPVRLAKGEKLRRVHDALDAKALHGEGGEIYNRQLILASKVSPRDFERVACADPRCRLRAQCYVKGILLDGVIYAVEGNTGSRSAWTNRLMALFYCGNDGPLARLCLGCEIRLNARSTMVANFALAPAHEPRRAPPGRGCNLIDSNTWPSVVLELGEARTLAELIACGRLLFDAPGSRLQLYVVFKYYVETQQNIALVYSRDDPIEPRSAISFGPEPLDADVLCKAGLEPSRVSGVGFGGRHCDQPELPEYELLLPAPLVFRLPPEQLSQEQRDYKIDLFPIKQELTEQISKKQVQALLV